MIHRASHTEILSITDDDGNHINIDSCIKNWENVMLTVQDFAQVVINNREQEIIDHLYNTSTGKRREGQSNAIGREIQADSLNVNGDINHNARLVSDFTNLSNYSRVDEMIRAASVTAVRGSDTRKKTWESIIREQLYHEKKEPISAGWARTVRPNSSKVGKVLNLTDASVQYCKETKRTQDTITFKITCGDEKVNVKLFIPHHLQEADKISLPKFVWNKNTNEFSVILTGNFERKKRKLSDRYIIGVDVGLNHYVTYVVYDTYEMRTVETGTLSNYLDQELWTSIRKTQQQISYNWIKIHELKHDDNLNCFGYLPSSSIDQMEILYQDICDQRKALSKKRATMSQYAALELRDISARYDNAPVARENLSWVGNTMQNGRWNCGEFFNRLETALENVGGKSIWVSAWKTSQSCSSCGNMHKKALQEGSTQFHYDTPNRIVSCEECGYTADRDINAAINIAKRAFFADFFQKYVHNSQAYDVQEKIPVFTRGVKKKGGRYKKQQERWRQENKKKVVKKKKKKRRRSNNTNRPPDRDISIVEKVRVPLAMRKSSKVVKKEYLKLLYPLQFNCMPGSTISDGSILVLNHDDRNRISEQVRKLRLS